MKKQFMNGCLVRYMTGTHGEKTGVIFFDDGIWKCYWPHMGISQPESYELNDSAVVEMFTYKGWVDDLGLIDVYPPIKTEQEENMWLMLYPEDEHFLKSKYKDLCDGFEN